MKWVLWLFCGLLVQFPVYGKLSLPGIINPYKNASFNQIAVQLTEPERMCLFVQSDLNAFLKLAKERRSDLSSKLKAVNENPSVKLESSLDISRLTSDVSKVFEGQIKLLSTVDEKYLENGNWSRDSTYQMLPKELSAQFASALIKKWQGSENESGRLVLPSAVNNTEIHLTSNGSSSSKGFEVYDPTRKQSVEDFISSISGKENIGDLVHDSSGSVSTRVDRMEFGDLSALDELLREAFGDKVGPAMNREVARLGLVTKLVESCLRNGNVAKNLSQDAHGIELSATLSPSPYKKDSGSGAVDIHYSKKDVPKSHRSND